MFSKQREFFSIFNYFILRPFLVQCWMSQHLFPNCCARPCIDLLRSLTNCRNRQQILIVFHIKVNSKLIKIKIDRFVKHFQIRGTKMYIENWLITSTIKIIKLNFYCYSKSKDINLICNRMIQWYNSFFLYWKNLQTKTIYVYCIP